MKNAILFISLLSESDWGFDFVLVNCSLQRPRVPMQFLETRDKIVHRRLKNNSLHLRGICVLAGEKFARILPLIAGEPKAGDGLLSLQAAERGICAFRFY